MSNIRKELTPLFLIKTLNKAPLFLKFNNYLNYFFLTNNLMSINVFHFFYFFDINRFKLKKINYNLLVKRNNYFFLKNFLKFRKFLKFNLIINKFKFKFNIFFKFIFLNKFKKINSNFKMYQTFFYFNNINFNLQYLKRFYKN